MANNALNDDQLPRGVADQQSILEACFQFPRNGLNICISGAAAGPQCVSPTPRGQKDMSQETYIAS